MMEYFQIKMMSASWRICRWFFWQILLFYCMPYLWLNHYDTATVVLMLLYTTSFSVYWEFASEANRFKSLWIPYLAYCAIAVTLCCSIGTWNASILFSLLIPLYGAACVLLTRGSERLFQRFRKGNKFGWIVTVAVLVIFLVSLKIIGVSWESSRQGTPEMEKNEMLARRNYLLGKLLVTPEEVLNEMPSAIGVQFQGEWALYSCSMLSAALVDMYKLYPETRQENLQYVDSLIGIVMSPELSYYDYLRWGEDSLESLDGDEIHISYLSHLAWMMCGYKQLGGDSKYDKLLSDLCRTMNRRILNSDCMNLPTYPGESIYIPDMLVAIVALNKYAELNNGKYRSTVRKWISRATEEWLDEKTGLLVSFLQEDGTQYGDVPVKGSYSALNCYYLTFIDPQFAKEQYDTLKSLFWKEGIIAGLKEYHDRRCYLGVDIDAGPILFELSPSGTAFMTGAATYFHDSAIRKDILRTAEIAGHSVRHNGKQHYLLANVALVGESIMLAMRTHFK